MFGERGAIIILDFTLYIHIRGLCRRDHDGAEYNQIVNPLSSYCIARRTARGNFIYLEPMRKFGRGRCFFVHRKSQLAEVVLRKEVME